jgi:hypothetical protein
MAGSATELHISGGNHITLPSRRKDASENDFSRLDVIFVEAPLAERPGKLELLANLVMAPLLVSSIYLMLLGQKLFKIAGLHDSHLVYDLAEEYDAEIVEVDMDLFEVITEYRLLWMVVHHGILLLAIFALPKFVDTFQWVPVTVLVPLVFVAAAVLIFGAFATGTMPARDMRMAYDVKEYSEENAVEDAMLVIGALHRAGVKKRLEDSGQVQIA